MIRTQISSSTIPVNRQSETETSLPDSAITHYNNFCSDRFADASQGLALAEKNFLLVESTHGRGIGGAGFAARLAKIYADELQKRSQIIIDTLKMAHADFGAPLAQEVDGQLKEMGLQTLHQQFHGLDGQFQRYLGRLGISTIYQSNLDQKYPLHQAAVSNQISRYLRTLRNFPMKSPDEPLGSTIINVYGSGNAVQAGANSTAILNQQWTSRDCSSLVDALQNLRDSILSAPDLDSEDKDYLEVEVNKLTTELKEERPNKLKLTAWMGGIAAAIQTTASLQPALEVLRATGRALGLSL